VLAERSVRNHLICLWNTTTLYLDTATCFLVIYDHQQAINTIFSNKVKVWYIYIYEIYIYISPHDFHAVGSHKFTVFITMWNCNFVLFTNFILQFNILILLFYILPKPTILLQTSATTQADFTVSYYNKHCKHMGSPRVNSIWWMFYVLHLFHILKYCLVARWWL
jgi:hypothetical protein